MAWATSGGDGFDVAGNFSQGGTFFPGYSGGDDTADLIVGPAVVLVVAAALGGFGVATIVARRGDRRAVAATGALVVSLISLGYALWDFDRVDRFEPGQGVGLTAWAATSLVAVGLAAALVIVCVQRVDADGRPRATGEGWAALLVALVGGWLAGLLLVSMDFSGDVAVTSFAFVLTVVVVSLASAAALALRALARPGVERPWRACLGSVDLLVCLGAYVLLPRVGQVG